MLTGQGCPATMLSIKDALEATGWDAERQNRMKLDIFSNNVRERLFEGALLQ